MLQQPALNAVLRHMAKGSHIEFHGLPERHFLSGWCFYDRRPLLKSGIRPHEVVGIHHNWLKGDANKWARAVSFGAVSFSDADAPGFLERARGSMVTQGAWREALRVLSRPFQRDTRTGSSTAWPTRPFVSMANAGPESSSRRAELFQETTAARSSSIGRSTPLSR